MWEITHTKNDWTVAGKRNVTEIRSNFVLTVAYLTSQVLKNLNGNHPSPTAGTYLLQPFGSGWKKGVGVGVGKSY